LQPEDRYQLRTDRVLDSIEEARRSTGSFTLFGHVNFLRMIPFDRCVLSYPPSFPLVLAVQVSSLLFQTAWDTTGSLESVMPGLHSDSHSLV